MNIGARISVAAGAGPSDLAGASDGARWFKEMTPSIDQAKPGVAVLDFAGVRLATVSWLREGPLALQKYVLTFRPDVVLVAANASSLVREELATAVEAVGCVMLVADISDEGTLERPCLLGRLDPALRQTLHAVEGLLQFDAAAVCAAIPEVGPSAASNRLAALASKGILSSERRGRSRFYRHLLEGVRYGH